MYYPSADRHAIGAARSERRPVVQFQEPVQPDLAVGRRLGAALVPGQRHDLRQPVHLSRASPATAARSSAGRWTATTTRTTPARPGGRRSDGNNNLAAGDWTMDPARTVLRQLTFSESVDHDLPSQSVPRHPLTAADDADAASVARGGRSRSRWRRRCLRRWRSIALDGHAASRRLAQVAPVAPSPITPPACEPGPLRGDRRATASPRRDRDRATSAQPRAADPPVSTSRR